jgi:two-component system phosphate regulon sensor histidine kinase PhoR
MKRKIFRSLILLSLVTVILSVASLSIVLYQQISEDMRRELSNQIAFITAGVEEGNLDYLNSIQGSHQNSRITLIDEDGTVLFDNRADASSMENHIARPEVVDAIESGRGESNRMSDTLNSETYYLAIRLSDGRILRISSTTDTLFATLKSSGSIMALIAFLILGLAILIARFQTRQIVDPINNLDLEHPIDNAIYDELSPLLVRIHHQTDNIKRQVKEIQKGADRFKEITEKMEEGLVVLDDSGYVLSINQSAIKFLGVELQEPVGKHYLNLNRSSQLQKAIGDAQMGAITEAIYESGLKIYQLRTTPIIVEHKPRGVILLVLDITEKQRAEKIRREFTANVSHELRTPLTAISGFAELMKDGMVKSEDVPSFANRIYEEASNLVRLIEDVLKLSQLDEKAIPLPMESFDLMDPVKSVQKRLSTLAERNGINITVSGESGVIRGVPQLIEELVTNLCDNAIKYNKEGGSVALKVSKQNGKVGLTVADTGIGIPKEHKDRIFERFYRVDKSHSKETGGTGLGLSIVKHIASYHQAEIVLESAVGIGTTITIIFPKAMDQ